MAAFASPESRHGLRRLPCVNLGDPPLGIINHGLHFFVYLLQQFNLPQILDIAFEEHHSLNEELLAFFECLEMGFVVVQHIAAGAVLHLVGADPDVLEAVKIGVRGFEPIPIAARYPWRLRTPLPPR